MTGVDWVSLTPVIVLGSIACGLLVLRILFHIGSCISAHVDLLDQKKRALRRERQ